MNARASCEDGSAKLEEPGRPYTFSTRHFNRGVINANRYYGPRNLDRCALKTTLPCVAQYERGERRPCVRSLPEDAYAMLQSLKSRPGSAVGPRYDTRIQAPTIDCSAYSLGRKPSVFVRNLTTADFNAALQTTLRELHDKRRAQRPDVDVTVRTFTQTHWDNSKRRSADTPRTFRHSLTANQGVVPPDGKEAATEKCIATPRRPEPCEGRLCLLSDSPWEVSYWSQNALDKISAYGRHWPSIDVKIMP